MHITKYLWCRSTNRGRELWNPAGTAVWLASFSAYTPFSSLTILKRSDVQLTHSSHPSSLRDRVGLQSIKSSGKSDLDFERFCKTGALRWDRCGLQAVWSASKRFHRFDIFVRVLRIAFVAHVFTEARSRDPSLLESPWSAPKKILFCTIFWGLYSRWHIMPTSSGSCSPCLPWCWDIHVCLRKTVRQRIMWHAAAAGSTPPCRLHFPLNTTPIQGKHFTPSSPPVYLPRQPINWGLCQLCHLPVQYNDGRSRSVSRSQRVRKRIITTALAARNSFHSTMALISVTSSHA